MANQQILLEQILRKVVEDLILGPQPIRSRNATHTRHLVHVDQRPAPGEPGAVLAVDEHHPRHDADVMLPAMAELMPPLAFDDFRFVDLVDGPKVFVSFIEEDGLEDVLLVGHGRFVRVMVHAELVLVVSAVKGHFYLCHIFGV